jgi:hypothetical protein
MEHYTSILIKHTASIQRNVTSFIQRTSSTNTRGRRSITPNAF